MKTLAERIKECRVNEKLTQEGLAAKVGLDQTVISKLERGIMSETTKIAELASALKVNSLWLATGKGKKEVARRDALTEQIVEAYLSLDEPSKELVRNQLEVLKRLQDSRK